MPSLHWIGKDKVINHHLDVTYRVLDHQYTFTGIGTATSSVSDSAPVAELIEATGNKIIHGDNLEALKSLLPEYEGKIKCIYIDPPYNTGNEGWVYNDNVNDPKLKKWLGQVVGKEAEDLTRHDKWLCMMYPRLKLLHKLLAEDGAIFISIDDNEQANLKLMCDEIFGGGNFVADVIWQHSIQPKGYLGKFSIHHNHTLVYSKKVDFILGNLTRTEEHNKAYSNPDNDPNGFWRTGDVRNALYRPNLIYDITTPSGKTIHAPKNGWRWSKETLNEKILTKEILFNKDETNIIRKIYLGNQEGRAPETIWFGQDVGTTRDANKTIKTIFNDDLPFDTPKPTGLIERILQITSNKNSIILDSFAGSGTTAHAVLNLNKHDGGNRKFILIEMEEYAQTITAERVKRVISGYGSAGSPQAEGTGGSFDYYELGPALFNEDNEINELVGVEKLRQYMYYTETKCTLNSPFEGGVRRMGDVDTEYFLNKHNDTAYYFYYEQDSITTLNYEFLSTIKTKAEQYVIYADNCLLTKEYMTKHKIIFKKIPRDITKF
jgi:adenine-specific DNA-methyltransferase